jgi:hypothetical protein
VKLDDRLRQTLIEKSELEAQHQFIKEQFQTLKQAKDQDDLEYKEQIQFLKEDSAAQLEEYRQ